MTNNSKRLTQLTEFISEHESIIKTALTVYAEYMEKESKSALDAYRQIKDDPERRAAQDNSLMTTNGLRMSGEIFQQAADKAQRAYEALEEITEEDY